LLRFLVGGVGAKQEVNFELMLSCAGIDETRTISLLRFLVGGVGAEQHADLEWVGVKVAFILSLEKFMSFGFARKGKNVC
jgi:hypothetical protein